MASETGLSCDRLFRVFALWAGEAVVAQALETATTDGVTPAQFRCLDFLARCERCCIGDLAKGLAISDPAVTKLVDRLQSKGLVTRIAGDGDRRVVCVQLSELGLGLTRRLARRRDDLLRAPTDALSVSRLRMLMRSLEAVLLSGLDSPHVVERVCLHCGSDHSPECVVNRARVRAAGTE